MSVVPTLAACCFATAHAFGPFNKAHAWEADVHYGLVKWLAVHAGFSLDSAETVAAASEAPDETNVLSAVGVSIPAICPKSSEEASRHVQQFHFPSGGYPPAFPPDRVVTPGDFTSPNSANRWVRQEIATDWGSGNVEEETRLNRFGISLHPLADSWSHQGEPRVFADPVCPPELAWGHPEARGERKHDADLTWIHNNDNPMHTRETAKSVYHFMRRFLAENPDLKASPSKDFGELIQEIDDFAKQSTRWGKYQWFQKQHKTGVVPFDSFRNYPCFLRTLNLPNRSQGRVVPCARPPANNENTKPNDQGNPVNQVDEPPVRQFVDDFLYHWIVKRAYDYTVDNFFNTDTIRSALLADRASYIARKYGRAWETTLLSMWLVQDHGLVNELGHGLPDADNQILLIKEVDGLDAIDAVENISEAIESIHADGPYDLVPLSSSPSYVVTFRFKHIYGDGLIMLATPEQESWRISGFDWLTH